MPYQGGNRLPGEKASKLGHLDVINSELVNEIINQFENVEPSEIESESSWESIDEDLEDRRDRGPGRRGRASGTEGAAKPH